MKVLEAAGLGLARFPHIRYSATATSHDVTARRAVVSVTSVIPITCILSHDVLLMTIVSYWINYIDASICWNTVPRDFPCLHNHRF